MSNPNCDGDGPHTPARSGFAYFVTGQDKACGAIGSFEPFRVTVAAEDPEHAQAVATRARYAAGREHVLCYGAELAGRPSVLILAEVRVLPIGTDPHHGNAILCRSCYVRELSYRRVRNRDLDPSVRYDLPAWEALRVYREGE